MATICEKFTQFLIDQQPIYDELILSDIRPTDSWVGNVATGVFPAFSGVEHRLDRMRHVFPNTTKQWTAVNYTNCLGTPCDPVRHKIGWGADRIDFHLVEQHWQTDVLCFDQMRHVTHAQMQWQQILSKILRPATSALMSNFLRKSALDNASNHFVVNATMPQFTHSWTVVGDEEIFLDTSINPTTVGKIAPQHLQVRFNPLMLVGYAGENPFKDTAAYFEFVTSIETAWELDKLGGATGVGGTPSIAGNWRFTQFDAANAYWRYGFSGQLGNYLIRTDPMILRFNFVLDLGAGFAPNRYRYQVILPYVNSATGGAGGEPGLGSDANPDFQTARFEIGLIMHKKAMTILTSDMASINSEMPFMHRSLAGKWRFVMDNLTCGTDVNGNPIAVDNADRNKGQFRADFEHAIRPEYTEFMEAFFYAREPMCLPLIPPCSPSPGYPTQSYDSANDVCPEE